MSTTFALMRAELTLLRRDTTAWSTAIALPFVLGGWWIIAAPPFGGGLGGIVALQVATLLIFTLHTVGTMSLASRREQLVLKRWRSSQARSTSVLIGSIGVPAGLVVGQAAVLIAVTASAEGTLPASLLMLAIAVLSGVVTVGALTFVAASFTRSSEHAMITTIPVVVLLMGSTVWALTRSFDPWYLPVQLLPGGATTNLVRLAWERPTASGRLAWVVEAAPSLSATIVLSAVATIAAARWFRWEPRSA